MKDALNDTLKLAIRDEVENRVGERLKIYWKFGVFIVSLVGAFIVAFSVAIWKVQVGEVRTQIAKALAEQKVTEAKDRILAIKTEAETAIQKVNTAVATVEANEQNFLERVAQIKQQDNLVFK